MKIALILVQCTHISSGTAAKHESWKPPTRHRAVEYSLFIMHSVDFSQNWFIMVCRRKIPRTLLRIFSGSSHSKLLRRSQMEQFNGTHANCYLNTSNSYLWCFAWSFGTRLVFQRAWECAENVYKFRKSLHVICLLKLKQSIRNCTGREGERGRASVQPKSGETVESVRPKVNENKHEHAFRSQIQIILFHRTNPKCTRQWHER